MSTQIGSAFIDVDAETQAAEGSLRKFSGRVGTILAGAGAAAVAGFGFLGKAAITMNADLETAELQFTTLLGSADDAAAHVASLFEFAAKTPFETQPIIDASRQLQIFGGEALNTEATMTLVGDAAAALNVPIGEVGTQVGKMFAALQGGAPIGEMTEQLLRMGVITPEVRNQINDLVAAGAPAEEIFGVLTGRLGEFEGAMQLQAESWHGLVSTIKDNLAILNAEALGPVFDRAKELATVFAEWLQSEEAAAWADRIADAIQTVLDASGNIGEFISNLGSQLSSIGEGGIDFGSLFSGLVTAAQTAFQALVDWLASGGLTMIVTGLVEGRARLFEAAMQLFPAVIDALLTIIPLLLETITGMVIPALLDFLLTGVPLLLETALTLFQSLIDALVTILPILVETLLGTVLPQLLATILGMIPFILESAIEAFLALVDAVITVLPQLLQILFGTVLPEVMRTVIDMAPEILQSAITAFLALIDAVIEILPMLIHTLLRDVLPAVLTTLVEMGPELLTAAIEAFTSLVEGLIAVGPELIEVLITQVIPDLIAAIIDSLPLLIEAGVKMMGALMEGIASAAGRLIQTFIDKVIDPIADLWPFSPAKAGPFRLHPPELAGRNVVEGFAEGMTQAARVARAAAQAATVDAAMGAMAGFSPNINISLNGSATVHDARLVASEVEATLRRLAVSRITQ